MLGTALVMVELRLWQLVQSSAITALTSAS
jgi:hypothetical protein